MKLSRFFVDKKTYKVRLSICKNCVNYFKPTGNCKKCGCFMKVKASIGSMKCPVNYWLQTFEIEAPKEIPEHLIKEVLNIWDGIKTGVAKDTKTKNNMIELYNTIYGTNYKKNTNCSSCINSCFQGIKRLYEQNKEG